MVAARCRTLCIPVKSCLLYTSSDEVWNSRHVSDLILEVIPEFDFYGITIVTKVQWDKMCIRDRFVAGLSDIVFYRNLTSVEGMTISWTQPCLLYTSRCV